MDVGTAVAPPTMPQDMEFLVRACSARTVPLASRPTRPCFAWQAEDTLVTIIPSFRHKQLHFISVCARSRAPRIAGRSRRGHRGCSGRSIPRRLCRCRCGLPSASRSDKSVESRCPSGWITVRARSCSRPRTRPHLARTPERLTEVLGRERSHRDAFESIPFHFIEIAALLFN